MAKEKAGKLPRKVAGVKVPKKLRKAGSAAMDLAQQPVVGEFVAAALTAAAASLMKDTKVGKAVQRQASDAGSEAVKDASAIGSAVKRALLDAARDLLDKLDDKVPEKRLSGSATKKSGAKGPA